jgi:hypothetical protein
MWRNICPEPRGIFAREDCRLPVQMTGLVYLDDVILELSVAFIYSI